MSETDSHVRENLFDEWASVLSCFSWERAFRSDDLNQALLFPPSPHDWLPEKLLARFLVDVVATWT